MTKDITLDSETVFKQNLEIVRKRSPQLAKILSATNCDGIEEFVGPRGATTLRENGVLLGSAYDPAREAEQLATTMASEPADIMIAIGFGLGEQFIPYCKQNPGTVIVFEPSPARLRAALSRYSIANLYGANRDFYIATEFDQFSRLLEQRYFPKLRLRVFPHPAILRLDPEAVRQVVQRTRRVREAVDIDRITNISKLNDWSTLIAQNGGNIASCASFSALSGLFQGRTAVVVAAGPSLDKQLALLKQRQDDVVIIAIGQTVKALSAAGIKPHLVHILESRNVSHQLTDAGNSTELNVVLSPDCHPAIYEVSARSQFVATPMANPMGTWIEDQRENPLLTMGGGTVALGAVGLAYCLGANSILLIGQDLAFTDGRAYARNSAYDFVGVEFSEDGQCEFTNGHQKIELLGDEDTKAVRDRFADSEVIWVDGWHEGERVATWKAYATFIEQYRETGYQLGKAGVRLVNCTEGGARIPNIEHLQFKELLDEITDESISAFEKIDVAYGAVRKYTGSDFSEAIGAARKSLDRIDRECNKALRFSNGIDGRSFSSKNAKKTVDCLRRLARYEKKLRIYTERVPWLDALLQPEIYHVMVAYRRTERLDPSAEEAVEESRYLFEATRRGVEQARKWFDTFEASFSPDSPDSETMTDPLPAQSFQDRRRESTPGPNLRP